MCLCVYKIHTYVSVWKKSHVFSTWLSTSPHFSFYSKEKNAFGLGKGNAFFPPLFCFCYYHNSWLLYLQEKEGTQLCFGSGHSLFFAVNGVISSQCVRDRLQLQGPVSSIHVTLDCEKGNLSTRGENSLLSFLHLSSPISLSLILCFLAYFQRTTCQ